jgi:hypothetical protein
MSHRSMFENRLNLVDRLESVLTNFYLAGEGPEWQVIWDRVRAILEKDERYACRPV